MDKFVTLLIAGLVTMSHGCGPPPLHPLTLVFPKNDCSQISGLCQPWKGCYALDIRLIEVHVGPSPSEDTEILCLDNVPEITTQVYYQSGKEYYTIDANYEQRGMIIEVNSGPFSEDEILTPWRLPLR